ncbi:MAG TPA: aldo/keto reductase [Phycisphaerae bacterium]|nr:aldo/keto reductase [Phycisphaerae bacterium]
MDELKRREFLGLGASLGAAAAAGGLCGWSLQDALAEPVERLAENIPSVILGRTMWKSRVIGLGTIFRPEGQWTKKKSDAIIRKLIEGGINVIETGATYGDVEERVGRAIRPVPRDKLFLTAKSTKITKAGFLKQVEASLAKLRTDYVDCLMLHNYSTFIEYDRVMGPGGAFEGLLEARKQGKARFIGMTSHGCQVIMSAMRSGKFDAFVLPFNAAHREFGRALDLAAKRKAGTLIMKPLGGSGLLKHNPNDPLQLPQTLSVAECLHYVLSHPGARVAIPNMSTLEHVKVALAAAATFRPLTAKEKKAIEAKTARVTGGVCSTCPKPCEKACENHVPISYLMSSVQELHRLGYDHRRKGDEYQVLAHDFMDCDGCGKCEKACPKKFAIRKELEQYEKTYRENRFNDLLMFEKTYR